MFLFKSPELKITAEYIVKVKILENLSASDTYFKIKIISALCYSLFF